MKKYLFISRHATTTQQHEIARDMGITIVEMGDMDAFNTSISDITYTWEDLVTEQCHDVDEIVKGILSEGFEGVIVVHPALALALIPHTNVGVWENEMRTIEGGKPTFAVKNLHIYKSLCTH
jgi:hypothetical protein